MPRSPDPELSTFLPVPEHTPQSWKTAFTDTIEEDDPVWKEYLDAAQTFDLRMLSEWNSFVDVILVFIGLLISVLSSFIIETQKRFSRDPAEVTNELLVLLIKASLNDSSVPGISHELDKVTELGLDDHRNAVTFNGLLYTSLAIAIAVSMGAVAAKLWLIRYIAWVREPGSPYQRAMNRQEAFSGLESWKFFRVINSLPILALISVFLFGAFVYMSICEHHKVLGFYVGKILGISLTFLLGMSCSAAFISSSPFQSPFSHAIKYLFNRVMPKRWRIHVVCVASAATSLVTMVLVARYSPAWQTLTLFPMASVFAVARIPKKRDGYSPHYGLPIFTFVIGVAVFTIMAVAAYFYSYRRVYVSISILGFVMIGFATYSINHLTRFVPNTLPAEAVAWLLESSSWQHPELFKKAGRVATTPQRKLILLNTLQHLLPPLIASRRRHQPGGPEHKELQIFIACLAQVSDFKHTKRSLFWENKAAMDHPALTNDLRDQLKNLRVSDDVYVRDAAEAVWQHYHIIDEKHVDEA